MSSSRERCLVVADTETTGLDVNSDFVAQLGAVAINPVTKRMVSQGVIRVKLQGHMLDRMSPEAAAVQGWTKEANDQGIPMEEAVSQFHQWLGTMDVMGFVAHNAPFDRGFTRRLGFVPPHLPWYCTVRGLKQLEHMKKQRLQNKKLLTLCQLSGYANEKAHDALFDSLACAHGYLWLTSQGVTPEIMLIT